MTVLTIILIIAVCGYCSHRTTGKILKSDAANVQSLGNYFLVGLFSVLTALPIALIGATMDSTLGLAHAALIGVLAGEAAFFMRSTSNPPATPSR